MKSSRFKTRHKRNRRLLTVALWALVFSSAAVLGSGPHQAQPKAIHMAMALGASGGAPHGAHAGGGGEGSFLTAAAVLRAPEAGGSHDDSADDKLIGDNLGPDGENGLAPVEHGAGKPDGDKKIEAPGPETFQFAESGGHFGGGYRGVGSGGGVGGGGTGGAGGTEVGQGDHGSSKPSPEDLPPLQTLVAPPHTDDGATDPACVLSNTCEQFLPDTVGPRKGNDFVGDGDHPGDFTPPGLTNLGAPSAAPEPATWLMLLVGFMGLGSALRAQRRRAALA
jgi:hypothetical protein